MSNVIYMGIEKWQSLLNSIRQKAGIQTLLTADTAKTAVDGIKAGPTIDNWNYMFYGGARKEILNDIIDCTKDLVSMESAFQNANAVWSNNTDLSALDMTQVTNMKNCFGANNSIDIIMPPQAKRPQGYVSMTSMHSGSKNKDIDVAHLKPSDLASAFSLGMSGSQAHRSIDTTGMDTSHCSSFASVCNGCQELTSIDISGWSDAAVTSSYDRMFSNCKLLTKLDFSGFVFQNNRAARWLCQNCTALTELTLGPNCANFGTAATSVAQSPINGCSNLRILRIKATTPPTVPGVYVFQSSNGVCPLSHIYVPAAAVEDYKTATNWSFYEDIIEADPEE